MFDHLTTHGKAVLVMSILTLAAGLTVIIVQLITSGKVTLHNADGMTVASANPSGSVTFNGTVTELTVDGARIHVKQRGVALLIGGLIATVTGALSIFLMWKDRNTVESASASGIICDGNPAQKLKRV